MIAVQKNVVHIEVVIEPAGRRGMINKVCNEYGKLW